MKNKEKGVLTIEAAISLLSITMFVLFLFNFVRVYRAQSAVGHATIQTADAIALESYLRENCYNGDAEDIAYIANHMTGSSNITADTFVSLRNTDMVALSKEKFILALGQNKTAADNVLKNYGIKNGVDGIDFSGCSVDLKNDDVIVKVKYTVKMQFAFFGIKEITLTKSAKAKTFGEILFELTVKSANERGGSASGGGSYQQGETVKIEAEANFGYRFKRWNDGSTEPHREITIDGDAEYIAEFERINYGVNVKVQVVNDCSIANGTDVTNRKDLSGCPFAYFSGTGEYPYESAVNLTFSDGEHYTVKYVKDNLNGKQYTEKTFNIPSISRGYDITVVVEPKTYSVKAGIASGNGTVVTVCSSGLISKNSDSDIVVKYGAMVTIMASPATNYRFEKWSDGASQNHSVTVTGNINKNAYFKLNVFTITVISSGNGNAYVNGQTQISAVYGTNVTISASPNSYYSFDKWRVGNSDVYGQEKTVCVTGNATYTACFKEAYSPSISIDNGGVNVESTQLRANTSPSGVAVSWSSSDPGILSIDGNGNITAKRNGSVTVTASFSMYGRTFSATKTVNTKNFMDEYQVQYCMQMINKVRHYYQVHTYLSNGKNSTNHHCFSAQLYALKISSYADLKNAVRVSPHTYKGGIKYSGWNDSNYTGFVLDNGSGLAIYFLSDPNAYSILDSTNSGYYISSYN